MNKISISESGVLFGEFALENIFQIEKLLTDLNYGDGINKVEFVLKQESIKPAILFVEAKSSIPRESDIFFEEIKLKMVHSLSLWFSLVSGRHSLLQSSLVKNLKSLSNLKLPIKLILVIPTIPDQVLEQINQKFRKSLEVERKIWDIDYSHILVLNESRAKKYKLIGQVC